MRRALLMLLGGLVLGTVQAQDDWDWEEDWAEPTGPVWTGFLEGAGGARLQDNPVLDDDFTLGELRGRLETQFVEDRFTVTFRGEALADGVAGESELRLRELNLTGRAASWLDLQAGRQVMTWGTGDLLFLNDLFPKDWVSFFAGRDQEYLKRPSDGIRLTLYSDAVNADVVIVPEFEPDNYIRGERFGFFSPLAGSGQGGIVARPTGAVPPNDPEWHLRLFRRLGSVEAAVYGYVGYWKSPAGFTPMLQLDFPELNVWGASLRGPLWGGVGNAEAARYDSREDPDGSRPRVANSEWRLLLGHERELATNLTLGGQYYLEHVEDHDALIANSPAPQFEKDEDRHLFTLRLTYRAMRDKLTLSWFNYWSPSDEDYYARPTVNYRYSDRWNFTAGANLFGGDVIHTFFGQFEEDRNVYARIRYNF